MSFKPFSRYFPKKGRLPLHQVVESFLPAIARDNLVHDFQKFLPLRFLLAEAVFNVGKSILLHFWYHLCLMVLLNHIRQRNGSFD